MPHIISDRAFAELMAYRGTGLSPQQVEAMKAEHEPAPLPLPLYEDDFSLGQGLLEDDGYDPALEAMERKDEDRWSK